MLTQITVYYQREMHFLLFHYLLYFYLHWNSYFISQRVDYQRLRDTLAPVMNAPPKPPVMPRLPLLGWGLVFFPPLLPSVPSASFCPWICPIENTKTSKRSRNWIFIFDFYYSRTLTNNGFLNEFGSFIVRTE